MAEVISRAKEMALKRIAMEKECIRLAKEEEQFRTEEIEKARKEFATEQLRLIEAEMAEARLQAQQAVAEAEARAIKEAEEAEIEKEIARLKARTPVEVLQDELEQMRTAMAEMAVGYKALLAEKRAVQPPPLLIAPSVKFQQKVPIALYATLYDHICPLIIIQIMNQKENYRFTKNPFAGEWVTTCIITLNENKEFVRAKKIVYNGGGQIQSSEDVSIKIMDLCGIESQQIPFVASPRTFNIPANNGAYGDPAVGHGKKLTINYRAMDETGNLRDFEAFAFEHGTCSFSVASISGFQIIKATWGNAHGCCNGSPNRCGFGGPISLSDVTEKVKSMSQ
jgi:hypothetical protein